MSEIVLKPCPFCGGEAEIERPGTRSASMIIVCQDCGCRVESSDEIDCPRPEYWKWNSRAATPQSTGG